MRVCTGAGRGSVDRLGPVGSSPVVLLRTAFAQIVLKYLQDVGQVSPSQTNPEMLLVVIEQRAGQQQKHASTFEDFGTEAIELLQFVAIQGPILGFACTPRPHRSSGCFSNQVMR